MLWQVRQRPQVWPTQKNLAWRLPPPHAELEIGQLVSDGSVGQMRHHFLMGHMIMGHCQ